MGTKANAIISLGAFLLSVVVACILVVGLPSQADALVAGRFQAKNVLFVGNSFTKHGDFGVIPPLEALAEANGKTIDAQCIVYSKAPLSSYAVSSPDTEDRYQSLEKALVSQTWDYVILKDRSMYPLTSPIEMRCSIAMLTARIHELQPNAEVLLYMTHGFNNGSKYKINGVSRELSASDFGAYVQAFCSDVGSKFGLRVVPVGMYFNRFDTCFPGAKLLESDDKHPTKLGFFIASCAFYEALFGEQPNVPATNLKEVSESDQLAVISLLGVTARLEPSGLALRVGQTAQLEGDLGSSGEEGGEGGGSDESGNPSGTSDSGDANGSGSSGGFDDAGDPDDSENTGNPDNPDDPGDSGKATFKSLDPDIATVNDIGLVEAVSEGTTAIVYEDDSGRRAACYVSVESDELMETKLMFAQERINLSVGYRTQVLPQISGSLGAYLLKWFSSDEDVAVVDEFGTAKAIGEGSAVIVVLDKASLRLACCTLDVVRKRLDKPVDVKINQKKAKLNGSSVIAMRVEWAPVDDAASYEVYRRVDNGEFELVKEAKKCVFVDKNAPVDSVVGYRVKAISNSELLDSKFSAEVKGVKLSKPKLTGTAKKSSVKLKWQANAAAKSYYIYRAAKGSRSYKYIARVKGATTTTWKDSSVKRGKSYKYRIRSVRTISGVKYISDYSKTVSLKIKRKKAQTK